MQRGTVRAILDALRGMGVFALGDGTGVGKARVIAGTIAEWLDEHPDSPVVWVTANARLHAQSRDEMRVVGAADATDDDGRVAYVSYASLLHRGTIDELQRRLRGGGGAAARRVRRGHRCAAAGRCTARASGCSPRRRARACCTRRPPS